MRKTNSWYGSLDKHECASNLEDENLNASLLEDKNLTKEDEANEIEKAKEFKSNKREIKDRSVQMTEHTWSLDQLETQYNTKFDRQNARKSVGLD